MQSSSAVPRRVLLSGMLIAGLLASAPGLAELRAGATIAGCGDAVITGQASLLERASAEGIKEVEITLEVQGLSDGRHAVHIHEVGACEPCGAAKGHHDPGPFGQSRPDSASGEQPATDINHPFHMGDLVNIEVIDGRGTMRHTSSRVSLSPGRLSILDADGSAFIIHSEADTYCDQETELSKGCAGGARDACGVIRALQ